MLGALGGLSGLPLLPGSKFNIHATKHSMADLFFTQGPSGQPSRSYIPLAERVRPQSLDEFIGQAEAGYRIGIYQPAQAAVGHRADGRGARVRHVEGKRNDPPSSEAVEMMDADTCNLVSPVQIVNAFAGGKYLVYSYNKSAKFRFNKIRGETVTLSGIFFDPKP